MNRKALTENLGHKFRLRPNPIVKKTNKPIKDSLNSWTFLDFRESKTLVLQSNHSEYKIEVEAIYLRGNEPPDMLVLRGQIFLEDNRQFSFEPFVEGMSADPRELTEDPLDRQSPKLYETLKAHEGQLVSIRFPRGDDGTVYGPVEAILQEVTAHFARLHRGGSACLDSFCQFISGVWRCAPTQRWAAQASSPSTRDRACVRQARDAA